MEHSNQDNLLGILQSLFKWKKPIIILCIATAILSVVITLLMPNYYKGETIFYPSNPSLNAPNVIFGNSTKDLSFYGDDEDIDRLLSIAQSQELIGFMVKGFDLMKVYDIDSSDVKAPHKVVLAFFKRYNVIKNERGAIELSIEDQNHQRAADMANAARDKIDEIAQKLNTRTQEGLLNAFQKSIAKKQDKIKVLSDSLGNIRQKYGVYMNMSSDKNASILNVKTGKSLEQFNKGLAYVQVLTQILSEDSESLAKDMQRMEELQTAFNSGISAIHVQDIAVKPVIKSSPGRSIIVITAVLIAFLFACFIALLLEQYREVNWSEIVNPK